MRDIVRSSFVEFSSALEGVVTWMYQDIKGLVTVAIGNLIDPVEYATALPFVWKVSQGEASKGDIASEWQRVKKDGSLARLGYRAAEHITSLRLTPAGISLVVSRKLESNDRALRARFEEIDSWPACAQLATHSMAWACGPAFQFPRLEAALRAQDWATAAIECKMRETGNPGLAPRNVANKILYMNASRIDPDALDWKCVAYVS